MGHGGNYICIGEFKSYTPQIEESGHVFTFFLKSYAVRRSCYIYRPGSNRIWQ
jgi:hypothetical protein